jgi:hypothetical protein
MANEIYPKFKEALWNQPANSNASTGTVKVALVDTGVYTYSASHEFVSSLSGTVGTAQTIGNKTFTNGVLDGDNVTFTGVTGNTIEALAIYIDTGNASTSRLISYQDTNVTGLPATPNGGDITITWNASGILAL